MTVLSDSDLETVDYGVAGWSAIVTSNIEKLDTKLRKVLKGNTKILGVGTVTDAAAATVQTLTDSTGGTPSTTIATTTDATIDNNFASLTQEINALRVDNADLRGVINLLLAELRISTGNGVLAG